VGGGEIQIQSRRRRQVKLSQVTMKNGPCDGWVTKIENGCNRKNVGGPKFCDLDEEELCHKLPVMN